MRRFILIGICMALFSTAAQAETMYISDIIKITLRTGPGTDHRVIAMVASGSKAEILNPDGEWTQIRLSNGKEGWVLTRFLTSEKPKALIQEQTKATNKALSIQVAALLNENKELKAQNQSLEAASIQNQNKFKDISRSYEILQKESAAFLKIKSKYNKSASELAEQTLKINQMEEELRKSRFNQNIKWFLVGAGVFFFGLLIGLSAKRQRRKSSLLNRG